MRAVESFLFDDLILKLTGSARRFNCINVKPGTNAASSHGSSERVLIDNFAARRVDEVSTFAHRVKEIRVEQILRFRIQGQVNTHNIRCTRNRLRRFLHFDTEQRRAFSSQTPAPRHHWHAKRTRAWDHLLTDLPDTNQAERATKQSACF